MRSIHRLSGTDLQNFCLQGSSHPSRQGIAVRVAENQREQAAVPHLQVHMHAESWPVT